MNPDHIIKELSAKNGNIITTRAAESVGVSRAVLSNLCKNGKLHRIAKGQYVFGKDLPDELLSISLHSSSFVFSHETALFLHGISDRTPFVHSLTVPTGTCVSSALRKQCKVYHIKPELSELGKTKIQTPFGTWVPCYDLERTVCDVIRSRNKMDTETFLSALKQYAGSRKKNLNQLHAYAQQMGLAKSLRQYMEMLL